MPVEERARHRPAGYGELLLYLDFDGVLHHDSVYWHPRRGVYLTAPSGYVLFQHVGLLGDALAPYPLVRIVLSTSWVRVFSYSRAMKLLPAGLKARVIGATYHSRMNDLDFEAMPRGMQVWEDVQRRRPTGWLALDNDGWDWPDAHRDHLVWTDDRDGLGATAVLSEFRQKLTLMCRGRG